MSTTTAARRLLTRRCIPRLLPVRYISTTHNAAAVALPITAHGPPPSPPIPAASPLAEHRARHKAAAGAAKPLRFWKEAHVVETPDGLAIHLDKRALKTPLKAPLVIPKSKPLLASAVALEWSHLRTSADATKSHRIPLTQMSARAIDMAAAEATGDRSVRAATIKNLIRYLDTDTVLCWAPTTPEHMREPGRPQLRDLQIAAATPIMDYLSSRVWPGLEIRPVDGDKGIIGPGQPRETREALISWLDALDSWALVGFERIVHATKSFVIGARMVAEWRGPGEQQWGVEEAAKAASIEVNYQTQQWGEVEDTHDVEKEDVKRQVGAGWLMIVGEV